MSESQYALDIGSLKHLSAPEYSQALVDWISACSSPSVSVAIQKEALNQIKAYELLYGITSLEIQKKAEHDEVIDSDIGHWLMLIESYPECLCSQ